MCNVYVIYGHEKAAVLKSTMSRLSQLFHKFETELRTKFIRRLGDKPVMSKPSYDIIAINTCT